MPQDAPTLVAETGRVTGSRSSNRLRAEGRVPGVVYGHGLAPVSVSVEWRELRTILVAAGTNAVLTLKVGGGQHLALVKELQRDPVKRTIRHVDFLVVSQDEVLVVDVPVVLEGESPALAAVSGVPEQAMQSLTVSAKPGAIPASIVVDISGLELGTSIRVADLTLPAGVTTVVDPGEPVVVGAATRATIQAADAAADEVGAGPVTTEADEEAAAAAEAAEGGDAEGAAPGEG